MEDVAHLWQDARIDEQCRSQIRRCAEADHPERILRIARVGPLNNQLRTLALARFVHVGHRIAAFDDGEVTAAPGHVQQRHQQIIGLPDAVAAGELGEVGGDEAFDAKAVRRSQGQGDGVEVVDLVGRVGVDDDAQRFT